MSNRLGTKAAAGILAAVAAGLALVAVPGALADVSVSDPAGDSGVAPDITGVSIKGDAHGNVALTVTMTQPQMNPDAIVVASFDTDSNPATGDRTGGLGADYFILADPGGFAFLGEVQAKVTFIHLTSTATVRVEPGKMTIGVNRSDLGDADRFQFAVESDLSDGNGITLGSDSAPNGPPYPEFQFPAAASLTLSVGKPGSAKGRRRRQAVRCHGRGEQERRSRVHVGSGLLQSERGTSGSSCSRVRSAGSRTLRDHHPEERERTDASRDDDGLHRGRSAGRESVLVQDPLAPTTRELEVGPRKPALSVS